jgi:hypothetical protein
MRKRKENKTFAMLMWIEDEMWWGSLWGFCGNFGESFQIAVNLYTFERESPAFLKYVPTFFKAEVSTCPAY